MKKISAVIQARVDSRRLKKKILLPILDRPMIFYIIERLKRLRGIDKIILSTSTERINSELIEYVKKLGIHVYSDNESDDDDLCSRLFQTCKAFNCDAILKINGDCPIPEINILQKMIKIFFENQEVDYISNKKNGTWPLGYSAEILSTKSLGWCFVNLQNSNDREFVASWISGNNELFKLIFIESKISLNFTKDLVVDNLSDFKVVEEIYQNLYNKKKYFNLRDVEKFFKEKKS